MFPSYSFSGDLCKGRNALDQAYINYWPPFSVECAIFFISDIFKCLHVVKSTFGGNVGFPV